MKIWKFGHSCLLVEEGEARVLVDPGKYSFLPDKKIEEIGRLSAVLLTHEHGDHADPGIIKDILAVQKVPVYGNEGARRALSKEGIDVVLASDKIFKIDGLQVESFPAEHEEILSGQPQNTAYVLAEALLITGDSLDKDMYGQRGIRALALPIISPWANMMEVRDFLKKVNPKFVIPVHDGFVINEFLEGQYGHWEKEAKVLGIDFRPLRKGEVLDI